MNDFFSKPVSVDDIKGVIIRHLGAISAPSRRHLGAVLAT